jgi:hypothetical protein
MVSGRPMAMGAGEMSDRIVAARAVALFVVIAALPLASSTRIAAQAARDAQARDTRAPRTAAPIDLTGYWVSVVTEDWRFRMLVPDKGDYSSVPLNPEGRKVADSWDPARDQADGNQCRSYGAAGLMRVPGRLHIYWENDSTLRIDTDSGTQTRLLHFGSSAPASEAAQWQGYSLADWEGSRPRPLFAAPGQDSGGGLPPEGYLKVITTRMRPGYLRKNGVPYSASAELEEYFDTFKERNDDSWLVVTAIVTDPEYLRQPFITSTHFRKLPDASGWDPTPCRANEPR